MRRLSFPAFVPLVLALAACSAPAPIDPLGAARVLPPTTTRSSVLREAALEIDVVDARHNGGAEAAAAEAEAPLPDARLLPPAADVVLRYQQRELQRSATFTATPGAPVLHLHTELLAWSASEDSGVFGGAVAAAILLRQRLVRARDGAVLLDRRYLHQANEKAVLAPSPDPLALACRVLRQATEEWIGDLRRVDIDGPPDERFLSAGVSGAQGALGAPAAPEARSPADAAAGR